MMKTFKVLLLLLAILYSISGHASEMATVLGYHNASNNELWQKKQIGFGVTNLLQQGLLDKTDFSLLDGKIVLGIHDASIEEKLQEYWMLDENKTSPDALKVLAQKHNLSHLFWVKIINFNTRTSKVSVGFFNRSEYKDTLTLEVCRYSIATSSTECQEGEATESRALTGVLYKPTEAVNFSESGAGRLGQEAINQSLAKLLHHE